MYLLSWLVLFGLQLDDTQWFYRSAGVLSDTCVCDSAARSGRFIAAGCNRGVWFGASSDMRLILPCNSAFNTPNQVRWLEADRFVASTPCGLYVIDGPAGLRRLDFLGLPVALDADGKGRAVIATKQDIWLYDSREKLKALLVADLEEQPPARLELVGGYILIEGQRRWLMDLDTGMRRGLSDYGAVALLGKGRIMVVDPQGHARLYEANGKLAYAFEIQLDQFERVKSVIAWHDRALILTTSRWLLSDGRCVLHRGALPFAAGRLVAVRGFGHNALPWLIADGKLVEPYPAESVREHVCLRFDLGRLFESAVREHSLTDPERPDCASAGWIPRIEFAVSGSKGATRHYSGGKLQDIRSFGRNVMGLQLTWSPEKAWSCPTMGTYELLRQEIMRQRQQIYEKLADLVEAYQASCRRNDRITMDEIKAHICLLAFGLSGLK